MLLRLATAVLATVLLVAPTRADEVADFYKGKTIQVVVGYGAGGGYDLYARMVARHMGKHLPGNPAMVVQNMPGAGSLRAANYLYEVAPKDGTVFGIFARNIRSSASSAATPRRSTTRASTPGSARRRATPRTPT